MVGRKKQGACHSLRNAYHTGFARVKRFIRKMGGREIGSQRENNPDQRDTIPENGTLRAAIGDGPIGRIGRVYAFEGAHTAGFEKVRTNGMLSLYPGLPRKST